MFFRSYSISFVCLLNAVCLLSIASLIWGQSSARPRSAEAGPKGLYSQGMAALEKGDLNGARESFEKVIRLAPSSPEAHNSLGWVLLQQGETDSAIVQFRSA